MSDSVFVNYKFLDFNLFAKYNDICLYYIKSLDTE